MQHTPPAMIRAMIHLTTKSLLTSLTRNSMRSTAILPSPSFFFPFNTSKPPKLPSSLFSKLFLPSTWAKDSQMFIFHSQLTSPQIVALKFTLRLLSVIVRYYTLWISIHVYLLWLQGSGGWWSHTSKWLRQKIHFLFPVDPEFCSLVPSVGVHDY